MKELLMFVYIDGTLSAVLSNAAKTTEYYKNPGYQSIEFPSLVFEMNDEGWNYSGNFTRTSLRKDLPMENKHIEHTYILFEREKQ